MSKMVFYQEGDEMDAKTILQKTRQMSAERAAVVKATAVEIGEALGFDKQVAWYLLKVLEAAGCARKAGKSSGKTGADVYEFDAGWHEEFHARLVLADEGLRGR